MPNPNRLRCPECRTRRTNAHSMFLHLLQCKRPLCHCMAYAHPHRPGSGECFANPEAQMRLAAQLALPGEDPLDIAADVALNLPGKPMRAWPFDQHGALRMREREIEKHLVERVKALGGEVRKVQWIGRRGAPDRLVMLPERVGPGLEMVFPSILRQRHCPAAAIWVELKAPGKRPTVQQLREHDRMRAMGQRVEVIDSLDGVTELLS